MDQYIGKMLDNRYEILERIGTGGMAVVYKAKCHRLNRLVALKILKSDLAQDEDFRRRFNAESQAVAQLSHPNIVSVYDVSRGGDTEYIVMELIDGITLKQYMEKRGQLNWRESLHFITQIMRGLSHAHSRGIVHRDIKPQNVMVLRDGSVKVADFGIACLENSAQTLTQEALGSVHYISPEQARGERTDARSDIYSAGVVMYEMLTGRLPFEGDSAVSVAIQHLSAVPLAPRELNSEIPAQLELICMKAMTPDLNRRYASADAMIADLEDFRKNPNINLDFTMVDLRSEEPAEPTQPIRTYDRTLHPSPKNREPERLRDRRRDYEDDYEPPRRSGGAGVKVLVGVAIVLALALVVVLFRMVSDSFTQQEAPQTYAVPKVVGYTPQQAAGMDGVKDIFTLDIKEERFFSDEYPAGTIVQQSPEAESHRKGDNLVIEVWLSAGEDTGEMLDVTNKTEAQANVLLKSLKEKYDLEIFADEAEMEFNDEVTEGYIIRSEPAKGDPLKKGDIIRLIISKGPEKKPVVVPRFIGKQIDEVLRELVDTWHLTCTNADIEYVESDQEPNSVIWQSLDETTQVTEWDTIQFKVSKGITINEREIYLNLPQDDRTTVQVDVYVGDEVDPQFSERVSCADETVRVYPLRGSGTQIIKVKFDNVLDQSQTQELQFD
ncbi:MAG: Stk1 family PASTA domain-containing Ser/Thr kinase [Oscillibacter sp.]|nr:Stk1 family PASTA domain-containing Ser/Thr kinase [Oscillibacter sp.]MCI9001808.1 Stk1 family PASTA domain-containing Ser/Thr kinase [Oscillibacter sp.]MCI9299361.1 Stk1 family PASTA domain-containing Ser/Thr kinase [Oscillibacter sp.]